MEERIVELEKAFAFHEDTLETLNKALEDCTKRIGELEKRLKWTQEQFSSGDYIRKQEDEEPPPHY